MKNINLDIIKSTSKIIIDEMKYKFDESPFYPIRKVYLHFCESVGKLILPL